LLYLVDGFTKGNLVNLLFYDAENQEFREVQDETYRPYFFVKHPVSRREEEAIRRLNGETSTVEKRNLFSGEKMRLVKVELEAPSLLRIASRLLRERWEVYIPYLLSYVYDHNLVFGVPYAPSDGDLKPGCRVDSELHSIFLDRFEETRRKDPEKFQILEQLFIYCSQPIPMIPLKRLGIPEDLGYEKIYLGFLLSRVANLPLSVALTDRHVSTWIKSLLHFHLRRRGILIPRAAELRRGEQLRRVPGALTFPPKMGTYFNTVVVDFESLYPSLIDAYNLSYETVNCSHPECRGNKVPGTDHHVCVLRRGVYSVLIGALKDLRIRWFKPLARDDSLPEEERRLADAASRLLKLILVSCYGVTVRIPGLSQPALAEAITAYGRYALRRTWEIAEKGGLRPLYGDTDSLFLDDPGSEQVDWLIRTVKDELRLDLAVDKVYSVCILPRAMKAYFGIMKDGTPEIKGVTAIKSNSPPFIRKVFEDCVKELANVRNWAEFEAAKRRIRAKVDEVIRRLRDGEVPLEDLVYQVKLHYDSVEKSVKDEALHQPYQSAVQLMDAGRRVSRGSIISFVKVKPFIYKGRKFTVKPLDLVRGVQEINVEDYVRNLKTALNQVFKPMNLKFDEGQRTTLADFI
jgi:DNA polymerase elongation subunit (family B)